MKENSLPKGTKTEKNLIFLGEYTMGKTEDIQSQNGSPKTLGLIMTQRFYTRMRSLTRTITNVLFC
jgi:hypothetical protein